MVAPVTVKEVSVGVAPITVSVVVIVPENFRITASSDSCKVQAMENDTKDRFGLQFHPEVDHSEYGRKMFENFIDVCKKSKSRQSI